VRIPSRKGNGPYFSSITKAFSEVGGVGRVEVNTATGSALFHQVGDLHGLAERARGLDLFDLRIPVAAPATLSARITEGFRDLDRGIKGFTGGEIDIPALAFLGLSGLGIYQIGRGNFMAIPWYAAFWYALNIFLKSDRGTKERL
jgi:hypothetical protein